MVLISVTNHLCVLSFILRKLCQERECYQNGKWHPRAQSREDDKGSRSTTLSMPGCVPKKDATTLFIPSRNLQFQEQPPVCLYTGEVGTGVCSPAIVHDNSAMASHSSTLPLCPIFPVLLMFMWVSHTSLTPHPHSRSLPSKRLSPIMHLNPSSPFHSTDTFPLSRLQEWLGLRPLTKDPREPLLLTSLQFSASPQRKYIFLLLCMYVLVCTVCACVPG